MISIKDFHVLSTNTWRDGFQPSRYSTKELNNGTVIWETIQRNDKGDIANWRGEWDGEIMKGILRRKWMDGTVQDFSFRSIGERMEVANNSKVFVPKVESTYSLMSAMFCKATNYNVQDVLEGEEFQVFPIII